MKNDYSVSPVALIVKLFTYLKSIVWKDIFKHRYGVSIEVVRIPKGFDSTGNLMSGYTYAPAVTRLVVKRPLSKPFNVFYNENCKVSEKFFTGHKWVLRRLYGIGSLSKENLELAESYYDKQRRGVHANEDLIKLLKDATKRANEPNRMGHVDSTIVLTKSDNDSLLDERVLNIDHSKVRAGGTALYTDDLKVDKSEE